VPTQEADTRSVVCFFSRADAIIRCEVRSGGGGYELVIDRPDTAVQVERFSGAEALNKRWIDVEGCLISQGWRGPAPRQHLKHLF
jgi:hypothetical protein